MDAQRIAVDAVVALTDCDRDAVTAFIRRLYLAGVTDPKRLTFKGLQAMAKLSAPNAKKKRMKKAPNQVRGRRFWRLNLTSQLFRLTDRDL